MISNKPKKNASFPKQQDVITFYKPLTLIVGSNGAGKTVSRRRRRGNKRGRRREQKFPSLLLFLLTLDLTKNFFKN